MDLDDARSSGVNFESIESVADSISNRHIQVLGRSSNSEGSAVSQDICRICHCESDTFNHLLTPCYCSGSLKYVHSSCLQQWLTASETSRCELCKFPFIMHTKIKPFSEWKHLEMSGVERRRLFCAVLFHCAAALCVVWSLCVLIERATEEVKLGLIGWPFWTKLAVVTVGLAGGLVFMYLQCRQYLHLCHRWRSRNRVLLIQNAPPRNHPALVTVPNKNTPETTVLASNDYDWSYGYSRTFSNLPEKKQEQSYLMPGSAENNLYDVTSFNFQHPDIYQTSINKSEQKIQLPSDIRHNIQKSFSCNLAFSNMQFEYKNQPTFVFLENNAIFGSSHRSNPHSTISLDTYINEVSPEPHACRSSSETKTGYDESNAIVEIAAQSSKQTQNYHPEQFQMNIHNKGSNTVSTHNPVGVVYSKLQDKSRCVPTKTIAQEFLKGRCNFVSGLSSQDTSSSVQNSEKLFSHSIIAKTKSKGNLDFSHSKTFYKSMPNLTGTFHACYK